MIHPVRGRGGSALTWIEVAERYLLTVQFISNGQRYGVRQGRGVSTGPRDCYLKWPDTIVVVADSYSPEDILHEMMHLVCASTFRDINRDDESFCLLPLERAIGRLMSRREREYQAGTTVIPYIDHPLSGVEFDVGMTPTNQQWWKEGTARAIELGLLTPTGEPTWKRHQKPAKVARGNWPEPLAPYVARSAALAEWLR